MLDGLIFTGRDLLIAVVLGTVVYLLEVALFSRRRADSGHKPPATALAEIESLRGEVAALQARVELLESRPPVDSVLDSQGSTYAEAMRMARDGHPPQEMAARLGISRGEAELITSLARAES